MAISWGTLGTNWSRPVFVAYVRTGRYTSELLEENPYFTVNVPLDSFQKDKMIFCGRNSGRHVDKVEVCQLSLVDSEVVNVPGILEFPLTLECKVIYKQLQELSLYPKEILEFFYPQDVDSSNPSNNKDPHYIVFGEIVNTYIAYRD